MMHDLKVFKLLCCAKLPCCPNASASITEWEPFNIVMKWCITTVTHLLLCPAKPLSRRTLPVMHEDCDSESQMLSCDSCMQSHCPDASVPTAKWVSFNSEWCMIHTTMTYCLLYTLLFPHATDASTAGATPQFEWMAASGISKCAMWHTESESCSTRIMH